MDQAVAKQPQQVEGDHAARQIAEMTRLVVSFVDHVSQAAQRSIRNLWIILAVAGAVGLVTIGYFVGIREWHISWSIVPLTTLAVPGIIILLGEKALSMVARLPQQVTGLGTRLAELVRDYWPQLESMEARRLKGLTKWRSYIFLAKLLWRLKGAGDESDGLMTGFGMIALVANPIFWLILIGAIIVLLVECVVMLVACGVYALFL